MTNKFDRVKTIGRLCVSLGHLPTAFKESLTYEEQLLWIFRYLDETIVPALNEMLDLVKDFDDRIQEELQKLTDKFNELKNDIEVEIEVQNGKIDDFIVEMRGDFQDLKNYVDNYFDNLDIQDEVNNKLDEMAESGALAELIALYLSLNGVFAYDTLSLLTASDKLSNGSIGKTLGKLSIDDGLGSFYKIRTKTEEDIVDGDNIVQMNNANLVAIKIHDAVIESILNNIGDLTELETIDISNLVNAINEVNSKALTIGDITDLETSDKSSAVAGINEVNSKIGDISELETLDKSSIVNSINEVNSGLNEFNFTIVKEMTFNSSSGNVTTNGIKVARNENGTVGKIYGRIYIANPTSNTVTITSDDSGLRPVTSINIEALGVITFNSSSGTRSLEFHTLATITINSDGTLSATTSYTPNSDYSGIYIYFFPCILFMKDYGD